MVMEDRMVVTFGTGALMSGRGNREGFWGAGHGPLPDLCRCENSSNCIHAYTLWHLKNVYIFKLVNYYYLITNQGCREP